MERVIIGIIIGVVLVLLILYIIKKRKKDDWFTFRTTRGKGENLEEFYWAENSRTGERKKLRPNVYSKMYAGWRR